MTMSLDVPTLRSFLVGKAGADGLTVGLDPTVTSDALAKQLAAAATAPQDASISIVNGVPTPAPGHPGEKCCAPTAPDVLFAALHARPTGPVDLPLEEVPPDAVDRSAERARPQGGRRELHDQAQGRRGPRHEHPPHGRPRARNDHPPW